MEAYLELPPIRSAHGCLSPEVPHHHEEPVWVIHVLVSRYSNADTLSRSSQMEDAPLIEDDMYAEFYEVEEPVIKYIKRINEIQHIQLNLAERTSQGRRLEWSDQLGWEGEVAWQSGNPGEDEGGSRSLICIRPFSVQDKRWHADVH